MKTLTIHKNNYNLTLDTISFIDKIFIKSGIKKLINNQDKIVDFKKFGSSWRLEATALGKYLISKKSKENTLYFCAYKNV